jgi:hypothetical protein
MPQLTETHTAFLGDTPTAGNTPAVPQKPMLLKGVTCREDLHDMARRCVPRAFFG